MTSTGPAIRDGHFKSGAGVNSRVGVELELVLLTLELELEWSFAKTDGVGVELELKFLLGMELEWSWSDLPPELPISALKHISFITHMTFLKL